jgi:hypothetical protein
MTAAKPNSTMVSGGPPKVVWRLVSENQFPLQGLLRLLFEPAPERQAEEGGGGRAP